jgi:hypothetical protein
METNVKTPAAETPATKPLTQAEIIANLVTAVEALVARVSALETAAKPTNKSEREMTDADARRILDGDLKDMKHNEAAKALNLSYGQIYSCRGEYTFRHIHKVLKEAGFKNPWKK